MRHNLPAIEINFPFQVDNLVLILSTTGFQNANDLGFPPIFIPRYLKGTLIQRQLRHLEKIALSKSVTPIVPTKLLWKLTFENVLG